MNKNQNLREGHEKMIQQEMKTRKNKENKKKRSKNKKSLSELFNRNNEKNKVYSLSPIHTLAQLKKTSKKLNKNLNLEKINPTFEQRFNFVINSSNLKKNYSLNHNKIEYKRAKYLIDSFNNLKNDTAELYKNIQEYIKSEAENIIKNFSISDYSIKNNYISKVNEIITNNYLLYFKMPDNILYKNNYRTLIKYNYLQISLKRKHDFSQVFNEWIDYRNNFLKNCNKYLNNSNINHTIIYQEIYKILGDIKINYIKNDKNYKLLLDEYNYNIKKLEDLDDKINKFNEKIIMRYRRML